MSLSRRALMLSAALLSAPHVARAQARRFRLGHNNSTDSVLHTASTVFAASLAKESGGRLQIDISPNSTLGTELQMLKSVADGTLDLSIAPVGTTATLVKEVGLVETPYLFRDAAQARAALDGPLGRSCAELLRPKGVGVLAWSEIGVRHITANRPVRNPAELRGLRIRVPVSEVILESFKVMGASPDILAFPQLPEALRTGRFEAQENPVNIILAAQLSRFQTHVSLTGHAYTAGPMLISADVWDELSAEDRAVFAAAAQAGAEASRAHAIRTETEGLKTLSGAGMTVVEDVDRPAFLKLGELAMEHLGKSYGADAVRRFRSATA